MIIIAVDPSSIKAENKSSFGAATVWEHGDLIEEIRFNTAPDIVFNKFSKYIDKDCVVGIEHVWAMPWDTPKTAFSLGGGFELIKFFSYYVSDVVELISPKRWQKFYGFSKKKGQTTPQFKKHMASYAKELFPQYKIINVTADSYLIGNYINKTYECNKGKT